MIVAFIAAGLLAGPDVLNIVRSTEAVALLSQISIAVLLFLVGLKLDMTLVRNLGRVAVATGLGQVSFTSAIGFVLCLVMGFDWLTSLYVAVALTFSSTIIIVKLLSDKREVDSLHGKIALGFLIVQDLFVVFAMVVVSTMGLGAHEAHGGGGLGALVIGTLALAALAWVFIRHLAEPLTRLLSRSGELLVIFAVAWAAGLAAVADLVGLGKELGGLLAGVTLASTPVRDLLGARLAALRDFLLLFFFLSLGAGMDLGTLGAQVGPAVVLSLFVLIGNPLIVLAIMGYMGYRKRTGFLAGLTVAQISEFSLIFMAMGIALGHVEAEAMGLVTLVGLVTITLSVYMITWAQQLYELCAPLLGIFERRTPFRELAEDTPGAEDRSHDVLVLGLGRFGARIAGGLRAAGCEPAPARGGFQPRIGASGARGGVRCDHGRCPRPRVPGASAAWQLQRCRLGHAADHRRVDRGGWPRRGHRGPARGRVPGHDRRDGGRPCPCRPVSPNRRGSGPQPVRRCRRGICRAPARAAAPG